MVWKRCLAGWTTLCAYVVLLCSIATPALGGPARSPLLPGQPFLVFWGVPDRGCPGRPDPAAFGMEWQGRVAVFYEDTLGLYPYYTALDQPINGGLPQHTSLNTHLQRVEADLLTALPQAGAPGLGVLRWKEWMPQWVRNRGKAGKYQEGSRALLKGFFPDWTTEEVEKWAQVDFEAAAQAIVMETLRELRRLRPQSLWGVAPFPDCYNSGPLQLLSNYTGRCPAAEMALNDELMWLWKRSSAIYPTLAVDKFPAGSKGPWLYSSNQIREGLRVAALARSAYDLPVFPLVKTTYASSNAYLSEADLVTTVGESAAMGAAGVIMWERTFIAKTQKSCSDMALFIREVLGPYVVNVTTAARLCGVSLCQGRGRCVRRNQEDPVYLHLPSTNFRLLPEGADGIRAAGELDPAFLDSWRRDFRCHFYEALEGAAADQESAGMDTRQANNNNKPPMLRAPALTGQGQGQGQDQGEGTGVTVGQVLKDGGISAHQTALHLVFSLLMMVAGLLLTC